jgi:hypothetical protein
MKIIDLGHAHPTLDEVMSLAQAELVVLPNQMALCSLCRPWTTSMSRWNC